MLWDSLYYNSDHKTTTVFDSGSSRFLCEIPPIPETLLSEKGRTYMPNQYHWYFAMFTLPHYDLCINEVYYGFLTAPEQPLQQTNRLKYLGMFPEGQLRTYINRGYIRDYYAKDAVERRDSV